MTCGTCNPNNVVFPAENYISCSSGAVMHCGEIATISYGGQVSQFGSGKRTDIKFFMNDTVLDSARCGANWRGAYLLDAFGFAPVEAGEYRFRVVGSFDHEEPEELAALTVMVTE